MKNHWKYTKGIWQASYENYMEVPNVHCPECKFNFVKIQQAWNKTNTKDWDCICGCGAKMLLIG